jgi:hypothetical protein
MDKIEVRVLNATRITKLLIAASRWLSKYADVLNDLNVYPIPDGDTGTNMSMTLQAVENELLKLNREVTMAELADIVSESILLGARGNSGTILSQIIQGLLVGINGKEEISIKDISYAFSVAKEKAYMSVGNPVEGTMLTVIRRVAEEAQKYNKTEDDFIDYLAYLKKVANDAVEKTPELLSKLKEAGVVDAGGKGIYYILEGFEKSVTDPDMLTDLERIVKSQATRRQKLEHSYPHEEMKYKYCTEFILENVNFDFDKYRREVNKYGDSVVCAQTFKITKTHIHTNNPGKILELACKLGSLSNIKIENMDEQHRSLILSDHEQHIALNTANIVINNDNVGERAFLAIADTNEMSEFFIKKGAAAVIRGGQSNNPSVADIEETIARIDCNKILILPNNKNIISTAKAAADRSSKEILVLETKSMLEGYYVIKNRYENLDVVVSDLNRNHSIEITKSIRDSKYGEIEIAGGDFIAIVDGEIRFSSNKLEELIPKVYSETISDKTLRVFVVKGRETSEKANKLLHPKFDIGYSEIIGNQENYHYYIYVENRNPELPEIAIVTDSTSDLTPELIAGHDISIIPLKIKFREGEYLKQGSELGNHEFWTRIIKDGYIPKTSQPSPAEFKELYEKLFEKGYKKIISIHISGKLSGTQQAAKVARNMLKKEKEISIIDSKNVWLGAGHLVLEAAKYVKQGESFEKIVDWIEEAQNKAKVFFVVEDLKYLEQGGRIGKASSLIGEVLQLKPVMKIENGEIYKEKKTIGDAGALRYMQNLIKYEAKRGSVVMYTGWGGTKEQLNSADRLRTYASRYKKLDYRGRYEIGPIIGAHSGPIYGFAIFPKIN